MCFYSHVNINTTSESMLYVECIEQGAVGERGRERTKEIKETCSVKGEIAGSKSQKWLWLMAQLHFCRDTVEHP